MWRLDSEEPLFECKHKARVNHVGFSPDGRQFVTASWDGSAQAWDAWNGNRMFPPFGHRGEVNWAEFSPAGDLIVTASRDKTVRIWSARTGALIWTLEHADAPTELRPFHIASDGRRLATVAGDAFQIWDLRTGRSIVGPIRPGGLLLSVRFDRDGERLITTSNDGAACLWDAWTGYQLSEPMRHAARVTYGEFSPDGACVVTGSWDETVRIWPVVRAPLPAPAWLPELAEAAAGLRLDANDVSEVTPVEEFYQLRQSLSSSADSDYYDRWARWFFADSEHRSVTSFLELALTQ
ncbi:MAG TPA: hypothetical protein VJW76_16675 [Verrucomicrobiae bacterium]|nr:hypothetical protein [Verrucomicrobiae bacterium]